MIEIPAHRLDPARRIAEMLRDAASIAVCTHVNGDGDGWGSAAALAHHYGPRGIDVRLLAASPFPERLRFLLPADVKPHDPNDEGREALRSADVQVVVDAIEPGRLGDFAPLYEPERTIVIDHHPVASSRIAAAASLLDPLAAATAELVYDVIACAEDPLSSGAALGLYVGLVTDTGSFRYSNTTPRTHRLAAALIEAGVDPEAVYRPLFARLTSAELGTLQAALSGLQRDTEFGISWTILEAGLTARFGPLDDYEAILDHIRNLEGTEVGILLRDLGRGAVKISLRSTGSTDVAAVARAFDGGGHGKAAGALVEGDLTEVTERVLESCRAAIRRGRDTGS
jgi:phosphoesterase RecJ-like protein